MNTILTMDQRLKLLLIDDDDLVIQTLKMMINQTTSWRVTATSDFRNPPKDNFHAAFVDMHLSNNVERAEGVEVVAKLHAQSPHLEIVAISGNLDRELMEKCLRAGASRFLAKPLQQEEILLTLNKIESLELLRSAQSRPLLKNQPNFIGKSEAAMKVQRQIAALREEAGPILIDGESGTGKEVTALLLHGQEAPRPFVPVNVAALPDNVFESEFFGHVKGAFTGADQNKMGLAEAANGGDLFLDEIEALPLSQQAKLLRFLETGEIRKVGSKDSIRISCRVIAATNRDLQQMVKEGLFREDLLWRLQGKKVQLPPLRERNEDIPILAEYFLEKDRPRRNKKFAADALLALQSYPWPGNIRELKRVCEQLSLSSPLPLIREQDVREILPATAQGMAKQELDLSIGLDKLMQQFEATLIKQVLAQSPNVDDAARVLQVSRSTLYKKIKDYHIGDVTE